MAGPYRIQFYLSSAWVDAETMQDGLKVTEVMHKKLRSADNSCSGRIVPTLALLNLLRGVGTADVKARLVDAADAVIFAGYLRKSFSITRAYRLAPLAIEIVSASNLLKRKIKTNLSYQGMYVSNPADAAHSILHQLLTLAGVPGGSISAPTILYTIPALNVEANKITYHDIIDQMLFEYGYAYDFDNSYAFIARALFPASISTSDQLNETNILGRVDQKKVEEEYDQVSVEWKETKTLTDQIVFSDTTGGDAYNKCNISIPADGYLGGYEDGEWYAEYGIDGEDLLSAQDVTLSIKKDSQITVQTFTPGFTRALLKIWNSDSTFARNVTKLDLKGTAVVLKNTAVSKVVNADTDKIQELKTEYIYAKAAADALTQGLASYWKYADFSYRARSRTAYAVGAFVVVNVADIGSALSRVVQRDLEPVRGVYEYELEAVAELDPATVTYEAVVTKDTPRPSTVEELAAIDEALQIASLRLTLSADNVTRARAGTLSPSTLTVSAANVFGVAYAGRFDIDVSADGSTFFDSYASAADESSKAYTIPATVNIAGTDYFVVSVRVRLYAAGGTTTLIRESFCSVSLTASAVPIYWGPLTSAPTGSVIEGDYYFDSRASASGGGVLRTWNGTAWVEFTSAMPGFGNAAMAALSDMADWSEAQGDTVAAAAAIFGKLFAYNAYLANIFSHAITLTGSLTAYSGIDSARRAVRIEEGAIKLLNAPEGGAEEEVAKIFRRAAGASFPLLEGDWRAEVRYDLDEVDFAEKTIGAAIGDFSDVKWSPELGLFVMAVYNSTNCRTSPDGITWTERTISATARQWVGIEWSPELGLFVMTAQGSTVCATSPDGITWTERTISASPNNWRAIKWSPKLGLFVMFGYGSALGATSPDGINWTERVFGTSGELWQATAWSPGLELFVVVYSSSNKCRTSPDGITWTERTISATARSWISVEWAPELGLFVMVGYNSTICATSPDGITWTERTISATARQWYEIKWSPELKLFVTTANASTVCATSPDGITWTERTISATSRGWRSIEWAPELGLFVIPGYGSTVCATWKLIDYQSINGYPQSGYVAGRGRWQKHADGTLVQWGYRVFSMAPTSPPTTRVVTWTLPIPFINDNYVFTSQAQDPGGGSFATVGQIAANGLLHKINSASQCSLAFYPYYYSTTQTVVYSAMAIGRWKA